ncbi:MAG: hypothetical protein QG657_570 [Acidobacteriota bacterium]|nr:hypothetical protein [Acidobacteriota bacterium]
MEKQQLLEELGELLNIPQIERIIAHKLEEVKDVYKDEIDLYLSLRNDFRKTAYGNMYVWGKTEKEISHTFPTYRFELDKEKDNTWKITDIEPSLPPGYHLRDIFPPLIIEYMTSFEIHPTRIETAAHFTHPKLKGRTFNLRFTRYSEYHLLGTITEIQTQEEETPSAAPLERELDNLVDINDYYKNDNAEMNYKELMYYMEKYPAFREHVFSEFFMKWKPLIDGKLLKLDCS